MKQRLTVPTIGVLLLALSTTIQAGDKQGEKYEATLTALNSSGVMAEVKLRLRGDQLKVKIEASGLEPDRFHPQHIHGHGDSSVNATCPTLSADINGDNLVSVSEGAVNYGPIVLPLTPFDTVDEDGMLEYKQTFTVDPIQLGPLHNRAIVLHGMSVNGEYIASLPVACGQLHRDR